MTPTNPNRENPPEQLKPRLLTITDACRYAAVSRSEFYETWLPKLRSVRNGKRRLVDRSSLDRFIDELPVAG